MTRGLREPDVAWNDGLEDRPPEDVPHVRRHLLPQVGPQVGHGKDDAGDAETRIERRLHPAQGRHQRGKAFECVVLAGHRNQHGLGRDECVDGQQAERWRRVDQHVVEPPACFMEQWTEASFAALEAGEDQLRAGQAAVRRDQRQPGNGRGRQVIVEDGNVVVRKGVEDRQRGRSVLAGRFLAEAAGQVRLGVEIDHEDGLVGKCKRGSKVDGGGGLADSPLLIGHGEHARLHSSFLCGSIALSLPAPSGPQRVAATVRELFHVEHRVRQVDSTVDAHHDKPTSERRTKRG